MIDSKKIKEVKKIKGKARGITLNTDLEYIQSLKAPKKLEEVKKTAKKIDPEFDYDKIKGVNWYPLWWRILSLIIIKEVFDWGDEEMIEMGRKAPKNSFVTKIVLKYFVSIKKTLQEGIKYFSKHYYPGYFEPVEYNQKEKYVRYRLKNFKAHPIICTYFLGYFETVGMLGNSGRPTKVKEVKCPFKNKKDTYHEFITEWE